MKKTDMEEWDDCWSKKMAIKERRYYMWLSVQYSLKKLFYDSQR